MGLHNAQDTEEWSERRKWRLWQQVVGMAEREPGEAQLRQAMLRLLEEVLPQPLSMKEARRSSLVAAHEFERLADHKGIVRRREHRK